MNRGHHSVRVLTQNFVLKIRGINAARTKSLQIFCRVLNALEGLFHCSGKSQLFHATLGIDRLDDFCFDIRDKLAVITKLRAVAFKLLFGRYRDDIFHRALCLTASNVATREKS